MKNLSKSPSDRELLSVLLKSALDQSSKKQKTFDEQLNASHKNINSLCRDNKILTDAVVALANQVINLSNHIISNQTSPKSNINPYESDKICSMEESTYLDKQYSNSLSNVVTCDNIQSIDHNETTSSLNVNNEMKPHKDFCTLISNMLRQSLGNKRYDFFSKRIDLQSLFKSNKYRLSDNDIYNLINLIKSLEFKRVSIQMFKDKALYLQENIPCNNRYGKANIDFKFYAKREIPIMQVNDSSAYQPFTLTKNTYAVKCVIDNSKSIKEEINVINYNYKNILVIVPENLDVSKSASGITSPSVKIVKGNITYLRLDELTTQFINQIRGRYKLLQNQY